MIKDSFDTWIKSVNWKVSGFNTLPIAFGVAMAALDIVMMSAGKMAQTGQLSYGFALPFATGIYALQPYLFIKAMNHENMVVTNLIWNLSSDVMVTLIGLLYFGESIVGLRWIALGMSIFSLLLFAYTDSAV